MPLAWLTREGGEGGGSQARPGIGGPTGSARDDGSKDKQVWILVSTHTHTLTHTHIPRVRDKTARNVDLTKLYRPSNFTI